MNIDRGTVVLVELDPTLGHEQRGVTPCIVVSDPAVNADQRFPLIAVVPVTGTPGQSCPVGPVAADELKAIDQGIELYLGLAGDRTK